MHCNPTWQGFDSAQADLSTSCLPPARPGPKCNYWHLRSTTAWQVTSRQDTESDLVGNPLAWPSRKSSTTSATGGAHGHSRFGDTSHSPSTVCRTERPDQPDQGAAASHSTFLGDVATEGPGPVHALGQRERSAPPQDPDGPGSYEADITFDNRATEGQRFAAKVWNSTVRDSGRTRQSAAPALRQETQREVFVRCLVVCKQKSDYLPAALVFPLTVRLRWTEMLEQV